MLVDIEQLCKVVVVDDRVRQGDLTAGGRPWLEQVPLGADGGLEGGDELLADGVERRVRHLGEELGEVVVDQPGPLGEHGEGGVGAHRADRLAPGAGHGLDDEAELLARQAEEALVAHDRGVLGREHQSRGQVV